MRHALSLTPGHHSDTARVDLHRDAMRDASSMNQASLSRTKEVEVFFARGASCVATPF